MDTHRVRCLILGCGNTLRGDDGIGPFLCAWAEARFAKNCGVSALASQQWTPELAANVSEADSVLFVDCSLDHGPGQILVREIYPASLNPGLVTHHLGAAELLQVALDLYGKQPKRACLLTIGAGSIELGEQFSPEILAAIPDAQEMLEVTVRRLLASEDIQQV